ncbi:uncharacterized protein LOC121726573 isoform X2 [Aricia agestis]|uniref:uncharacterized protein LOC121726573 isoform X2 n=1 Tax=Aricia agestis TaxID=91739 RepID=UPI001C205B95|nr:uncharacterized protein LOC121726573 isoform X2 [Aricia agestis]XP_041969917.1 uncharacterized protein LOC121726573 isoform X2 [Aricia agestis]
MSTPWNRRFKLLKSGRFSALFAELVAAVRRRGRGDSDEEEDLGLPQSPPASPPTDKADKRHHAGISQSSFSDGSLLSVGSSEMDEDSSSGIHHSHDHSTRSDQSDTYNTSEPPTGVAPLSHSAAKHKMAVRPRRTHGAPRRNKANSLAASALPITPELNEEIIRSTTPDVTIKTTEVVTESFSTSTTTKHHMIVKEQHQLINKELQKVLETPNDTKLKSSSLPPGLALNHLGQSQAKLSIAESNTPRSSIKRSKSSTQDQIRECSPKPNDRQSLQPEQQTVKYRHDKKYAEETCLEKKSKSEKKIENEVIRSSKKEESFFSRLLLRKSGKKSKKEQPDGECQQEFKKTKMEKSSTQYKCIDAEKGLHYEEVGQNYKPVAAERTYKSAGQKVFANQMHKRIDNKGAYVHDGAYKDVYSAAIVSGMECKITDLKAADETDKLLNSDSKSRISRCEEYSHERIEKIERRRSSSKEAIDDIKKESFSLHHDKSKRPASVQRLIDPYATKAFIANELACRVKEECLSPALEKEEDEPHRHGIQINNSKRDFVFHSGSMPKNIPYFNPSLSVSTSPKKHITHSSENVKYMSRSSEYNDFREREITYKKELPQIVPKKEDSYIAACMRTLGEDHVEHRNSIGKSHSFRYASESPSISSQDSQMPSLPTIVGISEPLLESWEVNYRRNLSERQDYAKRISARNYNIHASPEVNYDSLPSTESSYLDSLKTDLNDETKAFTNSIQVTMDIHKRDSDISQIEAKIDDIISSPKPFIAPILKSNSLDSIKGSPEKTVDDRRKTISVESALSQSSKSTYVKEKSEESFVSVTHVNKENSSTLKAIDSSKSNKSDEKIQKIGSFKPGVPEFLNVQLNKVDVKPATHVVLTANVIPKKIDSPPAEKDQNIESFLISENKIVNSAVKSVKSYENISTTVSEDKNSNVVMRTSPTTPRSPVTPKHFMKKKSISIESQDRVEKPRTCSVSTIGSNDIIDDNISLDRKSHSSFGSKSSIQSTDSNEHKIPDRHDETVIFRKKTVINRESKSDKSNDDEPELMKVFARRSLKLKDSEVDNLAQEIADASAKKEVDNNASKTKILKNEFNASIKSRDSDKENEDSKEETVENKFVDIATRVSQFGVPHYQRSVSIQSVTTKRDSAPVFRNEVNKYKKEVSDSTPEKRLRNRTFPDPSNDREDIKNIAKSEAMAYKADTLTKRPWQTKDDFRQSVEKEKRDSTVIEKDGESEKSESGKERSVEEADASPQFKGILQMRAEWERRAKQGMTK